MAHRFKDRLTRVIVDSFSIPSRRSHQRRWFCIRP